ncbi:MAG: hypothetical protein M3Y87_34920 [Myxococcota bacterium]|nr:hypothetical protein [Myxococcota bacterium]
MWKVAIVAGIVAAGAVVSGCGNDGVRAYDECTPGTTAQCEGGTGCFTIAVDGVSAGMCTTECRDALDCPRDARGQLGQCIAFPGGPFTCFESCIDSADCAAGWACTTSAGGDTFPPICLPI